MKTFNLIIRILFFFFTAGMLVFWVSQHPTHYPRNIIGYWPIVAGSLAFISFIGILLFLTKKGGYQNQKMPKKEIWLSVVIIVGMIIALTFLFLHSHSQTLHI